MEAVAIATLKTRNGTAAPARPASVTVVINTYNDVGFLDAALASVAAQTHHPDEVIVVDDGGIEDPAPVVARYRGVHLIRRNNGGLAAARNTGLAAAHGEAIVFLDADDRLLPSAIADGLDALARQPQAVLAFGGYRMIHADGSPASGDILAPARFGYPDLLLINRIGMHATVTYRRSALVAAGGFDVSLRRCEDYDLYFRLAKDFPVATHPGLAAEYRMHDRNMSSDARDMLTWVLKVHDRQEAYARTDPALSAAWDEGRTRWADYYGKFMPQPLTTRLKRKLKAFLPAPLKAMAARRGGRLPVGYVRLGDLARTQPISDVFGYDRGTPVDRGYIEDFLDRRRADIRGRVLEAGDDAYSRRFGGAAIIKQDVLHISADAPGVTIAGDLSAAGLLPKGAFDCLVLTQTLHLVFDMKAAVAEMHRSLKSGGVALVTVPGITRIDRGEWGENWFWSLTEASTRRLFSEAFGAANVEVEVRGNVYAATAFLQGLALEEADKAKLAVVDPCFPVILAVRAVKR